MTDTAGKPRSRNRTNWAVYIPGLAFLALVVLFAVLMARPGRDVTEIPSMLLGRQAPQMTLPAIPGLSGPDGEPVPGFDPAALEGRPVLVNVWASWCVPCRQEHPLLMRMAERDGVTIAGLNYKDKTQNALKFLSGLGNPYDQAGADQSGRAAIEWGVYGVPETFVVGADGTVLHKHTGPLTPEAVEREILPRLREQTPEK